MRRQCGAPGSAVWGTSESILGIGSSPVQPLPRIFQPPFDMSSKSLGSLGAEGGEGRFTQLPFLLGPDVIPPLQTIELRAVEKRQRNDETPAIARGESSRRKQSNRPARAAVRCAPSVIRPSVEDRQMMSDHSDNCAALASVLSHSDVFMPICGGSMSRERRMRALRMKNPYPVSDARVRVASASRTLARAQQPVAA